MDSDWSLPVLPSASLQRDEQLLSIFEDSHPELRDVPIVLSVEHVKNLSIMLRNDYMYCPSTWTFRAIHMLRLGFPELAMGDAYKALLLFNECKIQTSPYRAAIHGQIQRQTDDGILLLGITSPQLAGDRNSRLNEYFKNTTERASLVLAQALFLANCHTECYEFLERYISRGNPSHSNFEALKNLVEQARAGEDTQRLETGEVIDTKDANLQEAQRSGSISTQIYPWSSQFLQRTDRALAAAKQDILNKTEGKCYLGESNVGSNTLSASMNEKGIQCLGIKASRDMGIQTFLFADCAYLSGSDNHNNQCSCCRSTFAAQLVTNHEANCCHTRFCSAECKILAMTHYHSRVCGKPHNLREVRAMELDHTTDSPDTIAMNDLLYRLFAHAQNFSARHPLEVDSISAMTSTSKNCNPVRFSLLNDIKRPIIMLRILGIDIWKNHNFDTWVIQTIKARIRNNVRAYTNEAGHRHMAINLMYMFFNHSCDPNVDVAKHWSGSSSISVVTTKPTKRHEELCISYLDDEDLKHPYTEREKILKEQIGGECWCERCRRERAESAQTG